LTDFLAKAPTLDANWRTVVLFGRNVASCGTSRWARRTAVPLIEVIEAALPY